MRLAVIWGLGCWCLVAAATTSAWGQVSVAVIDMGAVFESHPTFLSQLESLKQEIARFEEEQNQQREALVARFNQLRGQDPSSEQYRQGESEIANQSAHMDVQKRLRSKEFAQKEARIYFDVYADVTNKVTSYCQHYGIPVVVHYNSRPMTLEQPMSIMERISSNVVYSRPDWEITEAIKQMCVGTARAASAQQSEVVQPGVNR